MPIQETDRHFQYMETNELIRNPYLSEELQDRLEIILKNIRDFYFSENWANRYYRRLDEEHKRFSFNEFNKILTTTSSLVKDTLFKLFNKDQNENGMSKGNTISLNINMSKIKQNDSHIENVIMHEFGHRQYNSYGFRQIVQLNKRIIKSPSPKGLKSTQDYLYFSNHNEIRQRIIPIVKEMFDNKWTSTDAYKYSHNLRMDAIYKLYTKDRILFWLDNIL